MQVVAFTGKELSDIVRQPRTLLVMVLGPFAVLALFGVGYDDAPPALRTVFVADPASPFRAQVETYAEEFEDGVDVRGIVDREDVALAMLEADEVDVVVALPIDPVSDLVRGERALMKVTHTRLDPIEQTAILFVSRFAVDEINAAILSQLLDAGRQQVLGLADPGTAEQVIATASETLGADFATTIVEADTETFVRPLDRTVELAVDDVDSITDWYAPAAVVLMLQQFGVAFGALAFVRERRLGINEVFRIAPVGGSSSVVGKYLAYVGVGCVVAAVLSVLVVVTLGVPMSGGTRDIALVMVLTLVASVGLGLVLSMLSSTETQAIQYTMLVLLASLFFSGFFLSLDQMQGVSRVVAGMLPASYSMTMLRDTMLRGADLDATTLGALGVYCVVCAALAVYGARRQMSRAAD
jgi:ABC-2 type transport system permease protein